MAGTEYGTYEVTVGITVSQEEKIDVDALEERIGEALSRHWEVKDIRREPGYRDEDYIPGYEDEVKVLASICFFAYVTRDEFGQKEIHTGVSDSDISEIIEKAGIKPSCFGVESTEFKYY